MNKGELLDHNYQIIKKLGSGAGGIVYQAFHIRLQKYVAIKKIKNNFLEKTDSRAEADILKKLHHPYLPQVYDFIQKGSDVFTVMDFVDGHDLQSLLDAGWIFGEEQILIWLEQLAQALAYLHSQSPCILHSDIKPSNIMITDKGNICLIDFNISLNGDGEELIGLSEFYAAPEQIQKAAALCSGADCQGLSIDQRSDIYSLGAVFYRVMTGVTPNVRLVREQPLRGRNTGYSNGLVHIIGKCLEQAPEKRYQSAEELLEAIHSIEKQDSEYRHILCKGLAAIFAGTLMIALGISCCLFGIQRKTRETFLTAYDSFCQTVETGDVQEVIFDGNRLLTRSSVTAGGEKEEIAAIYYNMGKAYQKKGENIWAETYLQKAVSTSAEDHRRSVYFMAWMSSLLENGKVDLAERILLNEKEYGITDAQSACLRGIVYHAKKEYENAIQSYQTALQSAEDDELRSYVYRQLGDIYWSRGDYEESAAMLEQAVCCGKERNMMRELAEVCVEYSRETVDSGVAMKYRKKAIEIYRELNADAAPAFLDRMNLVALYMMDGDYNAAETVLSGLKQRYQDYRIDMYLAYIAYGRNEMDQAESYYQMAYGKWTQTGSPEDENMEQLGILMTER